MIRDSRPDDAEALARIFNHYIRESIITFAETETSPEDIARDMEMRVRSGYPSLVVEEGGAVIGYGAGSPWRKSSGCRFVADISIYLEPGAVGRGLGTAMLHELLARLRARGSLVVIASTALPNDASVRMKEKLGFKKVGHLERVGFKFGRWIDVGLWQLRLD